MKIKEETRKLAAGCSKHCIEVVDITDEVSNHTYGKATLTWFEEIFEEYKQKGRARVLMWTRVEIRTYKMLGKNMVEISTAPEVIVVAYSGLKLLGILCITNYTIGFK